MAATLNAAPNPVATNSPVTITGAGFVNANTRILLDGATIYSWSKGGGSPSTFSVTPTTSPTPKTQVCTAEQKSGHDWIVVAGPLNIVVQTVTTDITPPTISAIVYSGLTTTGITISWHLSEAGTGQIEYGTTTAYGTPTTKETSYLTDHGQDLTGLAPGTLYHFRIKSADAAGNMAPLQDNVFATLPLAPTSLNAYSPASGKVATTWNAP